MNVENQNVEGLDLVAVGSEEFAGLSTYQQSYLMGRGLCQAQSTQASMIEVGALVTLGGNTEPEHTTWVAYQDGAIAGHMHEEDQKTGRTSESMRGPIAAKKDAQNGRQWFSRHVKKPLVAYWASQDPAREFVVPLKGSATLKAKEAPKTKEEKQAARVAKETKKLLDIEIAKARNTRDVLTKVIGAATRRLTDALKAGDAKAIKSAKANLDKIEKAITKAAE
jgi:hypothetical protein